MKKIFHLALANDWAQATDNNSTYYPPTYKQDGFTHGTSDANKLLEVANHFYTDSIGAWVCLEMTTESLEAEKVEVRYEPAASVGDTSGKLKSSVLQETLLFPHLYGGIHPAVVTQVFPVQRDDDGRFIEILFSTIVSNAATR
jgi:uncharacterized protein (DUF952 family)